jgi:hypothetical protein
MQHAVPQNSRLAEKSTAISALSCVAFREWRFRLNRTMFLPLPTFYLLLVDALPIPFVERVRPVGLSFLPLDERSAVFVPLRTRRSFAVARWSIVWVTKIECTVRDAEDIHRAWYMGLADIQEIDEKDASM